MLKKLGEIDGVLMLLFASMVFFTAALLWVEHFFPNDAQMFQVIAGLVTTSSGAFFGLITKKNTPPSPPPA